jgi:cell division protease FtsH
VKLAAAIGPRRRPTLDEDEAYAAAGIDRNTAAGARARGEAPEADPAPGLPLPRAPPGLTATGGRT